MYLTWKFEAEKSKSNILCCCFLSKKKPNYVNDESVCERRV